MLRLVGKSYEYDGLWLMSLVGVQRAVMCWRQGGRESLLPLLTLQPPLSLQMNPGPPPTPLHNTQVHHTLSIKHNSTTPRYNTHSPSNTTQFMWEYTSHLTATTLNNSQVHHTHCLAPCLKPHRYIQYHFTVSRLSWHRTPMVMSGDSVSPQLGV